MFQCYRMRNHLSNSKFVGVQTAQLVAISTFFFDSSSTGVFWIVVGSKYPCSTMQCSEGEVIFSGPASPKQRTYNLTIAYSFMVLGYVHLTFQPSIPSKAIRKSRKQRHRRSLTTIAALLLLLAPR